MRASRYFTKRIVQRPSADAASSSSSTDIIRCITAPFQSDRRRAFSSQSSSSATQEVVVDEYKSNHKELSTNKNAAITTTKILNNPERADATALVDNLLAYTRELMDQQLEENRTNIRHIVAFSGGIDSSLVLALLANAAATSPSHTTATTSTILTESVHAVMGRSPAVPQDQVALARRVANHIGIPLEEVQTTEGNDQVYIENNGQACLACKTHLYEALQAVAEHAASEDALLRGDTSATNIQQQKHHHVLYNGTNADDRKDATRVGLIAAQNYRVQSPLQHTTKDDVRRAARHLGLPNWNVAASPCLRSRLALGVAATQEHLERIEAAERFVRHELRVLSQKQQQQQQHNGTCAAVYSETTNLRVRLLAGNRACLEIDADLLPQVESQLQQQAATTTSWDDYFVQTLGFEAVHARAFRSGSVSVKTTEDSQNYPGTVREAVA